MFFPDCNCRHSISGVSSPACFHLQLAWPCAALQFECVYASIDMVAYGYKQSNDDFCRNNEPFTLKFSKGMFFLDLCWTKVLEMIILLAHMKKKTKKSVCISQSSGLPSSFQLTFICRANKSFLKTKKALNVFVRQYFDTQ